MNIAYLNGLFLPLEKAQISVMDRGFLFGDGVYEVIPVYGGQLFRLTEHLRRLEHSLQAIALQPKQNIAELKEILHNLVRQNSKVAEEAVYLQITRGVSPTREHLFPQNVTATVFAYCMPIKPPDFKVLEQGISAITLEDIRWQRCEIKAITLLANVLARQQAADQGAKEAIFIHDNKVFEGSSSNIFMVQDQHLVTPPLNHHILGGITRDLIIELAEQNGIPITVRDITLPELKNADGIWITSSTREIMPVLQLNETTINDGRPHPLWYKMIELFQTYKTNMKNQHAG